MSAVTRGEIMRSLTGLHLALGVTLISMQPWAWLAFGVVTVALVVVLAVSLLRQ